MLLRVKTSSLKKLTGNSCVMGWNECVCCTIRWSLEGCLILPKIQFPFWKVNSYRYLVWGVSVRCHSGCKSLLLEEVEPPKGIHVETFHLFLPTGSSRRAVSARRMNMFI